MPRREVSFVRGACYHVYNRGANRQTIFRTRDNSLYFLRKTRQHLFGEAESARTPDPLSVERAESVGRPISILAWCLMPNHFHFLVRLDCDDFSDRMRSLCKSYAQAINRAELRTGPLFEGRFRAIAVEDESYLLHLSRYIHRNPFDAGLVANLADWEFSSYPDYIGIRVGTLSSPSLILREFGTPERYRRFCEFDAVTVDLGHLLPDE